MPSYSVILTTEQISLLFVLVVEEWQRPREIQPPALAQARREVAAELADVLARHLWSGGSPKVTPVS